MPGRIPDQCGARAPVCFQSSPGDPSGWPALTPQRDPWTSGIHITWELVEQVESRAHPRLPDQKSQFNKLPGDSYAC